MSDADTTKNPTDEYTARIIIAAMTHCQDEEQAAALVAQYMVLAPQTSQVLDQAGDLVEGKRCSEAIALLDKFIAKIEQFSRPYPAEAVREVFGYDLAELYFARAVARFGASGSSEPAVLRDLDRAQSYPEACFAELDPEKPKNMREFRAVVEAVQKGQKAYEAKQGASQKSGGVPPATVAWWSAIFGFGLFLGNWLLSFVFGYRATGLIVLGQPLLALVVLIGISRWVLGRPFPLQRRPSLALYLIGVVLGIIERLLFYRGPWLAGLLLMMAGAALGIWLVEARTHMFSGWVKTSAATPQNLKLAAELTGAIMGMDGRYQAAYQRLEAQIDARDYTGAIRSATECIGIVEGLFRDYKEHFAANPEATTNYSGDLVTHYGARGGVRFDYARAGGPNPKLLLEQAAADIDKALSFPRECFRHPDARANLLKIKKQIQEARG